MPKISAQIFVCYHKEIPILSGDVLLPLAVGSALKENISPKAQRDDEGENISAKNPYFCELTGTYYIWKNVRTDIVGLCHYRRFLNLQTDDIKYRHFTPDFAEKFGITNENIISILTDNDVILPQLTPQIIKPKHQTLYNQYAKCHIASDMDLVLQIIKEKYPQMSALANHLIRSDQQMFIGNMLIAKKPIFDEYASFLFEVLFEVEKHIQPEVLKRDSYQQRVYGFLAERLMRVFMEYKKQTDGLRIVTAPMLMQEEKPERWRKYCFKRILKKIFNFQNKEKNSLCQL